MGLFLQNVPNIAQNLTMMNFTDATNIVSGYGPEFLSFFMISVISAGGNFNQECWLEFPLMCIGCKFESMQHLNLEENAMKALVLLSSLCNIIQGDETLLSTDSSPILINNLEHFKNTQYFAIYESNIRPSFPSHPETITVSFQLVSIENLDIEDSSFKIDFFLHQEWQDSRLQHHSADVLDASTMSTRVWIPDTYFVQSKEGEFIKKENGMAIKIRNDGRIFYRSRLIVKVSCSLDFHNFPMDIQACSLSLESYGHTSNEIIYKWSDELDMRQLKASSEDSLSLYSMKPLRTTSKTTQYVVGNWSTLSVHFIFVRHSIIFIPAMYFPCAIIVVISWITFIIDTNQYPARTYLCVTSILTMITLQAAMDTSMPKVSYIKAIDKYVLVCTLFIVGAFTEYACILLIKWKREEYIKRRERIDKENDAVRESLLRKRIWRFKSENTVNKNAELSKIKTSAKDDKEEKLTNAFLERDREILTKWDRAFKFYLKEGWPNKLDVYSRILFPSAFALFNAIYWITSGDNIDNVTNRY